MVLSAGACGVQERALAPLELALTAEPPYVSAANCALITPEPTPPKTFDFFVLILLCNI